MKCSLFTGFVNFSLFFNALAFVLLVSAPKILCKLHFKTIMRGTVSSVHWLLTLLFCREMLLTHWVWAIESTLSTRPLSILRLWCRSQTKRSRLKISCLMESKYVYTSLLERSESWGDQLCSSMEVDGPWALQVCPRVSLWIIISIYLSMNPAVIINGELCFHVTALSAISIGVIWQSLQTDGSWSGCSGCNGGVSIYFHWNGKRKLICGIDQSCGVLMLCSYRMAPDVHFPVQYDECVRAAEHFLRPEVLVTYSVDPERVAVCGDSAGGNLAAAVAQRVDFCFITQLLWFLMM